jgi:hypothetical protein
VWVVMCCRSLGTDIERTKAKDHPSIQLGGGRRACTQSAACRGEAEERRHTRADRRVALGRP